MMADRDRQVVSMKVKSKRLPKQVADRLRRLLNRLVGLNRFNALYSNLPPCRPLDLSRTFLEYLAIRLELNGEPLDNVPASGPVIFVANHPHGLIDGFALDTLLTPKRPDGALMAVYVLGEIPEYRDRIIMVGARGRRSRKRNSLRGWREAYKLLAQGGALVVFPAGGVARFQWRRLSIADQDWSPHVAALARRTGATVVPFYIHGRNSWLYQLIGMISPQLQNLFIFGQLPNMRNRTLRITAGRLIPASALSRLSTDEAGIAFLKKETEMLAGL